jgi:hypothetical protein
MPSFLASPPPQDIFYPATKKPHLETPIAIAATTAAEATTKTASLDFAMVLPPPDEDNKLKDAVQ